MIPRIVLGVAAALVLLLPWPAPLSFAGLLTLGGAAAAVWTVRAPGSVAPLVLLVITVVSWLSAVSEPGLVRTVCFAGAGYAVHSAAAMSSAVPAAAPIAGSLLRRWAGATMGALIAGWAVVAGTALLSAQPGSTTLVVLGMLAAVTLLALPALVVGRRASVGSRT